MKKIRILLAGCILIGFTANLYAQKDRKFSNGFSINLVAGFTPGTYGLTSDSNVDSKYQLSNIWGLQLGNRWYFKPKEKYGLGLMVNWLDFTAGTKTAASDGGDLTRAVVDISLLEIGPVGSFAVGKNIALDAYYNLRPTGFGSGFLWSGTANPNDEDFVYSGFGFTHAFGAAFRYKALNFGLEYVIGSIDSEGTYTGSEGERTLDNQVNVVDNFRIMIGFKF
jgi:hypothetical protein